MSHKKKTSRRQCLDTVALTHIRTVVERDTADLDARCADYRGRMVAGRLVVGLCVCVLFAFGADMAYQVRSACANVTTTGPSSNVEVCNTIYSIIELV